MEKGTLPSLGVLVYTHDRVDDAKMNMEIIRSLWTDRRLFSSIRIVHAYNGRTSWYPKKTLEDVCIRRPNPGHFPGAADLIDIGMRAFQKHYPQIQYVLVLAADTWCVKPQFVRRVLDDMIRNRLVLATCPWGLPGMNTFAEVGMATDFFIVDTAWAKRWKFFPLAYQAFARQYDPLLLYLRGSNVSLEKLAFARYLAASFRQHGNYVARRWLAESAIRRLTEREPVHRHRDRRGFWIRKFSWPAIGLWTHHDPKPKQKILTTVTGLHGPNIDRFRRAKDFGYYNAGRPTRRSYD